MAIIIALQKLVSGKLLSLKSFHNNCDILCYKMVLIFLRIPLQGFLSKDRIMPKPLAYLGAPKIHCSRLQFIQDVYFILLSGESVRR